MTFKEAILAAHAAGDVDERNRLMAEANNSATIRDLQQLLGCALSTAHKWTLEGRAANPCSRLDSPANDSTLVRTGSNEN